MENEYPWLDKPIDTWDWPDIKAEMLRCGETELDISRFVDAVDKDEYSEEYNRRCDIYERCLNDCRICHQYYYELYPQHRPKTVEEFEKIVNLAAKDWNLYDAHIKRQNVLHSGD